MNKQSVANVRNYFWKPVRNDFLRSDAG